MKFGILTDCSFIYTSSFRENVPSVDDEKPVLYSSLSFLLGSVRFGWSMNGHSLDLMVEKYLLPLLSGEREPRKIYSLLYSCYSMLGREEHHVLATT